MNIIQNTLKKGNEKFKVCKEQWEFLFASALAATYVTVMFIVSLWMTVSAIRRIKVDKEATQKLSKLVGDGKEYKVRSIISKEWNAFAVPGHRDVCYFTSLKYGLEEEEFYAILLHEAGHVKQKTHNFMSWAAETTIGVMIVNALVALMTFVSAIGPAIVLIALLFRIVGNLVPKKISRMYEYDADSYAAKIGYAKQLASAVEKISEHYNVDVAPCTNIGCKITRKMEEFFSTHPDTTKRIEELLKKAELYKSLAKGLIPGLQYAAKHMDMKLDKKAFQIAALMKLKGG